MTTHTDVLDAQQQLEDVKHAYLRRWGWDHTSHTPGSYWLWRRDFADLDERSRAWHAEHPMASPHVPYGVVTADTDMALSITVRCLDEQPELAAEDAA